MKHLQRLDISSVPSQPLRVSLYNRRKPTRPNITPKKRESTSLRPPNIIPRKRGSTMLSPLSMTPRAGGSTLLSPSNISPRTKGSTYLSPSSSNTPRTRGSLLRTQPRVTIRIPTKSKFCTSIIAFLFQEFHVITNHLDYYSSLGVCIWDKYVPLKPLSV